MFDTLLVTLGVAEAVLGGSFCGWKGGTTFLGWFRESAFFSESFYMTCFFGKCVSKWKDDVNTVDG